MSFSEVSRKRIILHFTGDFALSIFIEGNQSITHMFLDRLSLVSIQMHQMAPRIVL